MRRFLECENLEEGTIENYENWLKTQDLAANTRRVYAGRLRQYFQFLKLFGDCRLDASLDSVARERSLGHFKSYAEDVLRLSPKTINLSLNALSHYHRYIGVDAPTVVRAQDDCRTPMALNADEQKRVLEAAQTIRSSQSAALVSLILYTGLRVGECINLDVADIVGLGSQVASRVKVRPPGRQRTIPLHRYAESALRRWLIERALKFDVGGEHALFVNRQGLRLTHSRLDSIVRHVGIKAELNLSARLLRTTFIKNLYLAGNDPLLIAFLAGVTRADRFAAFQEEVSACEVSDEKETPDELMVPICSSAFDTSSFMSANGL